MSGHNMLGPVRKWGLSRPFRRVNRLSECFFLEDRICNFAISGWGSKAQMLYDVLWDAAGRIPMVILHNESSSMTAEVSLVWNQKFGSLDEGNLWYGNDGGFEPFLMLDEVEITQLLRKMAEAKGLACNVFFDQIVGAFLMILDKIGCPYSLTGLHYLCSIRNIQEFRDNVMDLDCDDREKHYILSELGLSDEGSLEQLKVLRRVVQLFAHEAQGCGWRPGMPVGDIDLTTAVQNRAALLFNISSSANPLMMTYLAESLRRFSREPMLLLIEDLSLEQTDIVQILREAGQELRFGILGSSILDVIGGEKEQAQRFCDRLDRIVLLRHRVATTARAVAELLGTHEVERETRTEGMGKKAFGFLPDMYNAGVSVAKEDRLRIQPEELMKLPDNRAILFDLTTDEIVYF